MTIATPTQSYATIAEADAYLKLKETWIALNNDDKDDALLWARYFIDINFDCTIDMDAIDDEVKYFLEAFSESLDVYKKGLADGHDRYLEGDPAKAVFRKIL